MQIWTLFLILATHTKSVFISLVEFQSINVAILKMAGSLKSQCAASTNKPPWEYSRTFFSPCSPVFTPLGFPANMTLKSCFIYLELFAVPRHNLFLLLYGETNNTAFLVCRLITLLATRANNSNHLITGMLRPCINLQPAFQIKICFWFGKHTFDSKYTRVLFVCSCMDFNWIWKQKHCIPSGFHNKHSMV